MARPPRYIVLQKPVGQTPLEAVNAWKAKHPELSSLPATYAGRLDPMASGTLLILLGEECRKRDAYTELDKEYEIEVVLGLRTDTGDVLGLPTLAGAQAKPQDIDHVLGSLRGAQEVPYPAYSSKTMNGKPLFQYALEGTIDSLSIPTHTEQVFKIKLLRMDTVSADALRTRIYQMLTSVPRSNEPSKVLGADFRQDQIRRAWQELFDTAPERDFDVLSLRVTCASGTYMRTLAARLGAALSTSGFALSIHRTKIGRYVPIGPFGFWRKTY